MTKRFQILLLSAATAVLILVIYKFFIAEFALSVTPGWNTKILPRQAWVVTAVLALTFFGGMIGIISLLISQKERDEEVNG